MDSFFKSIRFKILVTIIAVLFGFMLYSASTDGIANMPEKLLSYITVPVQKVTSSISSALGGVFDKFADMDKTYEENQKLQEEINTLRESLVDYENTKKDKEHLETIVGIISEHHDYTVDSASIIQRDGYESFTIDKGSLDNVSVLDPIITASGLVGLVDEVGPRYAVVKTILSPQIDVGAYEAASASLGIVTGEYSLAERGLCKMEYLEKELKVGDIIVTSGSSGVFPKDLQIGTVVSVNQQSHGASYYAEIKPTNDITKLTQVFVMTSFDGQGISQSDKHE